jgi:hypothetical protein
VSNCVGVTAAGMLTISSLHFLLDASEAKWRYVKPHLWCMFFDLVHALIWLKRAQLFLVNCLDTWIDFQLSSFGMQAEQVYHLAAPTQTWYNPTSCEQALLQLNWHPTAHTATQTMTPAHLVNGHRKLTLCWEGRASQNTTINILYHRKGVVGCLSAQKYEYRCKLDSLLIDYCIISLDWLLHLSLEMAAFQHKVCDKVTSPEYDSNFIMPTSCSTCRLLSAYWIVFLATFINHTNPDFLAIGCNALQEASTECRASSSRWPVMLRHRMRCGKGVRKRHDSNWGAKGRECSLSL